MSPRGMSSSKGGMRHPFPSLPLCRSGPLGSDHILRSAGSSQSEYIPSTEHISCQAPQAEAIFLPRTDDLRLRPPSSVSDIRALRFLIKFAIALQRPFLLPSCSRLLTISFFLPTNPAEHQLLQPYLSLSLSLPSIVPPPSPPNTLVLDNIQMAAGQYNDSSVDNQSFLVTPDMNSAMYDGGTSSDSSASSPLNCNVSQFAAIGHPPLLTIMSRALTTSMAQVASWPTLHSQCNIRWLGKA